MSKTNSPYHAFAALLSGGGQLVSPAELHGLLLGRSCGGAGFEPEPWLEDAAELIGAPPEDNLRQALIGLQEMVKGELTGDDMAVVLFLPDDETPIGERTAALGQWCQGFMTGFGLASGDAALSEDAMDVLNDLNSIAQIDEDALEGDDAESDYMEVMEYLRVAPLLLFTERGRAPASEPKPSLH